MGVSGSCCGAVEVASLDRTSFLEERGQVRLCCVCAEVLDENCAAGGFRVEVVGVAWDVEQRLRWDVCEWFRDLLELVCRWRDEGV